MINAKEYYKEFYISKKYTPEMALKEVEKRCKVISIFTELEYCTLIDIICKDEVCSEKLAKSILLVKNMSEKIFFYVLNTIHKDHIRYLLESLKFICELKNVYLVDKWIIFNRLLNGNYEKVNKDRIHLVESTFLFFKLSE